jgi:hypothetical protein
MQKAPSFYLTAIGAARVVGGPPGPLTPLLLIFHGRAGEETAFAINAAVRASYPSIEQLQVVSIIDLHHIQQSQRVAVELTLSAAYRQAAKHIPEELDPTEYVVIAPDWSGTVTRAYGMNERVNDIGLVLVSNQWQIFDTYRGADPIEAALNMVASVSTNASDPPVESPTPK